MVEHAGQTTSTRTIYTIPEPDRKQQRQPPLIPRSAMASLTPPPRTLMIAGGTDGIGFSLLVSELERDKYALVYVLGRCFDKVRALGSARVVAVPCDITELENIRAATSPIRDASVHDFVLTIGTFCSGKIEGVPDGAIGDHFHLNCVSNIRLIRSVLPKLVAGDSQILVCTASLAVRARSPYALQSATKAALRAFVDALRIELSGKTRVMNVMPPSVRTAVFAKAGDFRATEQYPPASRVAGAIRFMLDCPPDVCIPELLMEQHRFDPNPPTP